MDAGEITIGVNFIYEPSYRKRKTQYFTICNPCESSDSNSGYGHIINICRKQEVSRVLKRTNRGIFRRGRF